MPDLAEAIRNCAGLQQLSVCATSKGYQANVRTAADGAAYRVDIRRDPVSAILVAIGAVGTLEMNRREKVATDLFEDLIG